MAEYQITYWREIPSLVVVRDVADVTKSPLPSRFQEAIDDAAMRLGDVSSDAYLDGWRRTDWAEADGTPASVSDDLVARLEAEWAPDAVQAYLDNLSSGTTTSGGTA